LGLERVNLVSLHLWKGEPKFTLPEISNAKGDPPIPLGRMPGMGYNHSLSKWTTREKETTQ